MNYQITDSNRKLTAKNKIIYVESFLQTLLPSYVF